MSILIKGMKMPERCIDCELCTLKVMESPRTTCIICRHNGEEIALHGRRNDCPLIELPPHGRLIDADALLKSISRAIEDDPDIADVYEEDYQTVNDWLVSAPTIIESEGE